MVSGQAIHKLRVWKIYKIMFCCIARGTKSINFCLIAHRHGTQAEKCLFSEIPGSALLHLLPSEVGYMARSSTVSAMDGSLQRPVSGASVMDMWREANVTLTLFFFSWTECDQLLLPSLSFLHLNWTLAPSTFQLFSLHQTDTLSYE